MAITTDMTTATHVTEIFLIGILGRLSTDNGQKLAGQLLNATCVALGTKISENISLSPKQERPDRTPNNPIFDLSRHYIRKHQVKWDHII